MHRDQAYYVRPPEAPGPGVLLLHSWWGLTREVKRLADRLADEGFTVLVPDLNAGEVFDDPDAARRHLMESDANRLASLVLSSVAWLAERTPAERVAVVGLSMGASLGLWASVRRPAEVGSVVAFYGTQSIDFSGAAARYQLHLADDDHLVSDDEAAFMQATMGLENLEVEVHHYPGTRHWFFEPGTDTYQPEAAELAWRRMVEFLRRAAPPTHGDAG